MKKNTWLLIIISLIILVLIWLGVWYVFKKREAAFTDGQKSYSLGPSDRSATVNGFDKKVLIPANYEADFNNNFGEKHGSIDIQNNVVRILLKPDKIGVVDNKLSQPDFYIENKAQNISTSYLYVLVDEKNQVYRDVLSDYSTLITYYQRIVENGNAKLSPFIVTKLHDSFAEGFYCNMVIKQPNATAQEKLANIANAERILIEQLP